MIKGSFDNLETLFKNANELKELTGFMKKNIQNFEESKEKSQKLKNEFFYIFFR